MASYPQQQQSRRSAARPQTSDEGFQQVRRQDSEAPSTTSVDSQTLLLDHTSSSTAEISNEESQEAISARRQAQDGGPIANEDVRRCWICFSDETDDTSPRVWRNPCPCALTAHESCLLDWIADLERPNAGLTTAGHADIKCPQCKNEIYLARPHSTVLEYAGALEKAASNAILPATVFGISYSILLAFSHHGVHTIQRIFGDEDASVILAPRSPRRWNYIEREAAARFPNLVLPFLREWRGLRVELGLPLIPAALVASRTEYGDALLPFLPIAFFATHGYSRVVEGNGRYWPPSAALTLVVLPYVRSLYNEYMERVWADRERGWMKEIRPRLGSESTTDDGAARHNDDDGQVEEIIDIQIDLNIGGEEDEEIGGEEQEEERQHGLHDPPADQIRALVDVGDQPPEDIAEAVEAAVDEAREQQRQRREQRQQNPSPNPNQGRNFEQHLDLFLSLRSVTDTIVGALLFPSIAAASGDLIRMLLPKAWTAASTYRGRRMMPTGLLQTKWGRSVVGGCLFVVLKDAIRIYCRWRMAVSFRERRVKDYDKERGIYL